MRKEHVVFDFIEFTVPEKVEDGRNKCMRMGVNPIFVKPDVPYEDILAKSDELEKAYLDARNDGKTEKALMHKIEKEWDDLMRNQALYVNRIANGDASVIFGAGFNVADQPAPRQIPEFSLKLGNRPGSVILRRMVIPGAVAYIWQYCIGELPLTPEGWVTAEINSKASVEITNLTLEVKYWFRVAVVTTHGTSAYTAPIMQIMA